ncbi:hypothetical protein [Nocardia sp. NPDC004711]
MALPATTPQTPGPDRTPDQKRTGYRGWDARWDNDFRFRHQLRVLTAVFTLDAVVRVAFAYTLPLDAVPLATTLQWLVALAGLITFHIVYVTRNGLKV